MSIYTNMIKLIYTYFAFCVSIYILKLYKFKRQDHYLPLFCFIRTPYFRSLIFSLSPDLGSVTFCRICNRSKGNISNVTLKLRHQPYTSDKLPVLLSKLSFAVVFFCSAFYAFNTYTMIFSIRFACLKGFISRKN